MPPKRGNEKRKGPTSGLPKPKKTATPKDILDENFGMAGKKTGEEETDLLSEMLNGLVASHKSIEEEKRKTREEREKEDLLGIGDESEVKCKSEEVVKEMETWKDGLLADKPTYAVKRSDNQPATCTVFRTWPYLHNQAFYEELDLRPIALFLSTNKKERSEIEQFVSCGMMSKWIPINFASVTAKFAKCLWSMTAGCQDLPVMEETYAALVRVIEFYGTELDEDSTRKIIEFDWLATIFVKQLGVYSRFFLTRGSSPGVPKPTRRTTKAKKSAFLDLEDEKEEESVPGLHNLWRILDALKHALRTSCTNHFTDEQLITLGVCFCNMIVDSHISNAEMEFGVLSDLLIYVHTETLGCLSEVIAKLRDRQAAAAPPTKPAKTVTLKVPGEDDHCIATSKPKRGGGAKESTKGKAKAKANALFFKPKEKESEFEIKGKLLVSKRRTFPEIESSPLIEDLCTAVLKVDFNQIHCPKALSDADPTLARALLLMEMLAKLTPHPHLQHFQRIVGAKLLHELCTNNSYIASFSSTTSSSSSTSTPSDLQQVPTETDLDGIMNLAVHTVNKVLANTTKIWDQKEDELEAKSKNAAQVQAGFETATLLLSLCIFAAPHVKKQISSFLEKLKPLYRHYGWTQNTHAMQAKRQITFLESVVAVSTPRECTQEVQDTQTKLNFPAKK